MAALATKKLEMMVVRQLKAWLEGGVSEQASALRKPKVFECTPIWRQVSITEDDSGP